MAALAVAEAAAFLALLRVLDSTQQLSAVADLRRQTRRGLFLWRGPHRFTTRTCAEGAVITRAADTEPVRCSWELQQQLDDLCDLTHFAVGDPAQIAEVRSAVREARVAVSARRGAVINRYGADVGRWVSRFLHVLSTADQQLGPADTSDLAKYLDTRLATLAFSRRRGWLGTDEPIARVQLESL